MTNSRVIRHKLPLRDYTNELGIEDHIREIDLHRFLLRQDIPGLVRALYVHPNAAQNHCIYYKNGLFYTHNKNKWIENKHTNVVVRELMNTAYRVFRRHFNSHIEGIVAYCTEVLKQEPNMYKIEKWLQDIFDDQYEVPEELANTICSMMRKL